MNTNDVLRRLRFALKLNDGTMLELMAAGGNQADRTQLDAWFLRDDEPGYVECPKAALSALLDGMILTWRGPRDAPDGPPAETQARQPAQARPDPLDNNAVLKKVRIALQLKEEDMLAIMKLSGVILSKNELSAFFRARDHRNYKECMDQFLRNFLAGLVSYKKA